MVCDETSGAVATESSVGPRFPTRIRHPFRWRVWTGFVVGLLCTAFLLQGLFRKKQLDWGVVGKYFFNGQILDGVRTTIELGAESMLLGLVLGILLAMMRLSNFAPFKAFAGAWVWLFRMIPVLVLLVVIYNIAIIYPTLSAGVPFGPALWSGNTRDLLGPFLVAIICFGVNESPLAAEIIRTSILSIDRGQWEAGQVLGMGPGKLYRLVILPQAFRIAVPPLFNDFINIFKGTALVSFIGLFDLFYTTESIYEQNFEVVPLLIVMTSWYLIILLFVNLTQVGVERRYNRRLGKLGRRG